ncbi:hypothetical protein Tco_0134187 [Tanacetum coccineum]
MVVGWLRLARNWREILRDREDYDRSEQSNKRHKSEDQYQSATQQSTAINRSSGAGHDQRNSDVKQFATILPSSDFPASRVPSEGVIITSRLVSHRRLVIFSGMIAEKHWAVRLLSGVHCSCN